MRLSFQAATMLFGALAAAVASGCADRAEAAIEEGVTPPPAGTEWLEGGEAHWAGWIELVPSIRTPRFADGRDMTRVHASFPAGASITLADPSDRSSLVVPPGTEIDRVEWWRVTRPDGSISERVLDVRGTRFTEDHEELHVFRPAGERDLRLFGARWARAGAPPRSVLDSMTHAMLDGHGLVGIAQSRREPSISRFSSLLSCEQCHAHQASARIDGTATWPRRPTDASGLYSILATLSDTAVLETYRPRDDNRDDPFVHYECAPGSVDCQTRLATIRLEDALETGAPHASAVCASRRALLPHLSHAVRDAFHAELEECGAR